MWNNIGSGAPVNVGGIGDCISAFHQNDSRMGAEKRLFNH
jgi:hypothetical protein